ncbi:ABC-type transporter, integral membrane subunit [Desulfovibrio sp. X2]|uniref:ABC transporter permease n=1 Tax=Desulfovibrio sp. X2 TaxID=941449 RepID=UPI000358C59C|nr:ABC transporter permease [Desulfovibrio sp. X2]EPR41504.1 ABC-type transporter, integral membrane subunit [Desulfovibrio sp. X2]
MFTDLAFLAQIAVKSSVAVALASLGELLAERSGVLNLGVEGMMLMGALTGFAASLATGSPWLGVAAAMLVGLAMAALYAFFAVGLRANQVLAGLSLTILGMGLSNFLGRSLVGQVGPRFLTYAVPGLAEIPVVGQIFFRQSALAYVAYALVPVVWWLLARTRAGLAVRACGQGAAAADAAGVNVARVRFLCTCAGGLLAGAGGAYLSLAYTPGWANGMTGGQGWIAVAMVIFAAWHPGRAFGGAMLFGLLQALQFWFQATGQELIPAYVLRMLPYLMTIAVLAVVQGSPKLRRRSGAPAELGTPFSRGG